jgi:hypothetical protein
MPKRQSGNSELSYDPRVMDLLGIPKNTSTKEVKRALKAVITSVCKPCWELKYCPYGPLVEQFPLPRGELQEAIEHNDFVKQQLKAGAYKGKKAEEFSRRVASFDANKFPEAIPEEEEELMRCTIFGHFCPVFFSSEGFTETR